MRVKKKIDTMNKESENNLIKKRKWSFLNESKTDEIWREKKREKKDGDWK